MRVLHEHDIRQSPPLLDWAWEERQTFAFLPDRTNVTKPWIDGALSSLPENLREDHFALLTSGSTGQPKLVIGRRERAEKLARVLHAHQFSAVVAETITVLPLTYCYAFVNQWLWSRVCGRRLILTDGFSQPDVLGEQLSQASDAMLCLVGAQAQLLESFGKSTFPGITRVHFAGGRFPQDKLDTVRRYFPNAQIFNNYGCAEAMPRLTIRRAEDSTVASYIGRPLPGIELRTNESGALLFRSTYGAVGYVDGVGFHDIGTETWVETGDLAIAGESGTWELVGRSNEVFKRYGEKVALPMIQSEVGTWWRGQLASYREKDAAGEEGYVLVLAPQPTSDEVQTILKGYRSSFSRPLWPLRIEGLDELPRLHNGKVDGMRLSKASGSRLYWRQRL